MDQHPKSSNVAGALFKAFVSVVAVAGSAFAAYVLVFQSLGVHGDNTVPLLCALTTGMLAGLAAAYCVKRLFR